MKIISNQRHPRGHSQRGLTTIELLIVSVILAIALNSMASAIVNTTRLTPIQRENATAMDAARTIAEEIRSQTYNEVFARYNADLADDPALGTSPGSFFAVTGLQLADGDPDGFVGEILFPVIGDEVREDYADRNFGMPRDLNEDGVQDMVDHAGDYEVLPFCVRLEWKAKTGHTRDFSLYSVVTRK